MMDANHDAAFAKLALQFAEALVASAFESAHDLLSPEYRATVSPGELRSTYEGMVDYGDGPATDACLITTMESWPDRQPNDLGWAYVAIIGEGFSEAITVVVETQEAGSPCIRHVEWGRP